MKLITIYCLCIALVHGSYAWGEICRRSDPNVNKCILDKIEAIRPKLSAEPLQIDRISADTSVNGVKMKGTLENVVAYRGNNLRIEYFKGSQSQYQYTAEVKVVFPQMYLTADYYFQGIKFLFFEFRTNGKFTGKFENIAVVFNCVSLPVIRNGEKYLQLDSVTAKVSIANAQLNLEQADRSWAGRKIATYARSDPAGAMRKVIPAIEDNAARLFKQYVGNYMSKVPLNYLLSD